MLVSTGSRSTLEHAVHSSHQMRHLQDRICHQLERVLYETHDHNPSPKSYLFGNFTLSESFPGSWGWNGSHRPHELGHWRSQTLQFILKVFNWLSMVLSIVKMYLHRSIKVGKCFHLNWSLVSCGKQRLHTPLNGDELVVHLHHIGGFELLRSKWKFWDLALASPAWYVFTYVRRRKLSQQPWCNCYCKK